MKIAIKVDNVSKLYRLGEVGTGTLSHDLNRWWHRIRGKEDPYMRVGDVNDRASKGLSDYVWAVKDINFSIPTGEVVGIIGRNGAGKSTLLKILSRVSAPTQGAIKIRGRIASLLEVGTGFHPELTGRGNIFLNGAILGMRKNEIAKKFDEIVAFSGCERYIDTPVKRYSSGMYVRLAFAVAAHLDPEIMVVDEVLAVGDAEFQKKCLGKMKDVSAEGRTIIFVSHNMTAIQTLCNSCLLLEHGQLTKTGAPAQVIAEHLRDNSSSQMSIEWGADNLAPRTDFLKLTGVSVTDGEAGTFLSMQSEVQIDTKFFVERPGPATHLTYHLVTETGIVVLTSGCRSEVRQPGSYKASVKIPANLLNSGEYTLKLFLVEDGNRVCLERDSIVSFQVHDISQRDHACMNREPSILQIPLDWQVEKDATYSRVVQPLNSQTNTIS